MDNDIFSSEIVIMGCGNVLYQDDGIGCNVANRLLESSTMPKGVHVVDAGLAAPRLINLLKTGKNRPGLVLVDAGDFGGKKGDVKVFDVREFRENRFSCTSHGISLSDELLSYNGKVHLVVCQVDEGSMALKPFMLTKDTEKAIDRACKCVMSLVKEVNG